MPDLTSPPSICLAHKSGMIAACLLERQDEEPLVPFILNDLEKVLDIRLTVDQAEALGRALIAIAGHARDYKLMEVDEI